MSTANEPLKLLTGSMDFVEKAEPVSPLPVFDSRVTAFLSALSTALRKHPAARAYPDLAAFAFWCRRGSLAQMEQQRQSEGLRLGRGLAFHVCPGNVPLNFAYSLAAGLLAGCACAVRLSSRDFPQAQILCGEMDTLLRAEFPELLPYVTCLQCDHDHPALARLSERCDARVLWGGDAAIHQLRQLPLSPRAVELAFADRYSVCVIDAGEFLSDENPHRLAERFYRDVSFAGQWACTAPRVLLWLGDNEQTESAQKILWEEVERLYQSQEFLPISAVQKREQFCLMAAEHPEIRLRAQSNRAVRVQTPTLSPGLLHFWTGDGMFLESRAQTLDALLPLLGDRCQTLAYYGITPQDIRQFLTRARPRGIDRVVPLGSTMQFSLVWDGIDLIQTLSRSVTFS